ncbi:hypothetical protein F4780DRAFT_32252 [Xylariomycetidae sp. FL0641]|nr:hypothetical protein F4780DRAFT_32252 [Xylariomycetidae sp. FL0641]
MEETENPGVVAASKPQHQPHSAPQGTGADLDLPARLDAPAIQLQAAQAHTPAAVSTTATGPGLPRTESKTHLLNAPAPVGKAASLTSQASFTSLPVEGEDASADTPPRGRSISLKPSLASLPEAPKDRASVPLSPIQSASPRSTVAPASPGGKPKPAQAPPGPLNNPDNRPSPLAKYKKAILNFLVGFQALLGDAWLVC